MFKQLRPTPAMIVAVIALVAALGGTSYAAVSMAKNSVGTKQIRRAPWSASISARAPWTP